MSIIDVNALFGHWPIQRRRYHTLAELDAAYERCQIDEVWLSAAESILAPDPMEHDLQLFRSLRGHPRFRPVLTLRPTLRYRTEKLLVEAESGIDGMRPVACKVFPNYHSYPVNGPEMETAALVAKAFRCPLLVQIQLNDIRSQPPVMEVAPVDVTALAEFARKHPELNIIALSVTSGELKNLKSGGPHLHADMAFLDGKDALTGADEIVGAERLCFGSMAGLAYPEAALLKLFWTDLGAETIRRIAEAGWHLKGRERLP